MRDIRCVKKAIAVQLIRLEQVNGQLLLLCVDCVNVVKVTDTEAVLVRSIEFTTRTNRVGILPGFDLDDFPFVMSQNWQHTEDHETTGERCRDGGPCLQRLWRA